jgi:hypothetical protein
MKSGIDEYLDHVDEWKLKVHEKLRRMTPQQRKAFWQQIHDQARERGLQVVEPEKKAKRPPKRPRQTG